MPAFAPIPLGRPIPDSPHGVSCSLPTMRAVRGYEEKDPEITRHLTSGYPRFVVHPFARQLAARLAPAGRELWLTSSARMARELAGHLGGSAAVFSRDGLHGATHAAGDRDSAARAKLFLQHLGGFLSSREAEDHLVRLGLARAAAPEESFAGDAAAEVRRHLRGALPGAGDADLILANSGANAVYAAFRAVGEVQAPRGRTGWVQLGWLYLDTIAVMRKFTAGPASYHYVAEVTDLGPLERLLAERGATIAGLISEVPTNPLVQTPDAARLAALCRRHGVALILDPSMSSPFSVDLLPHADLLVSSLTKYAASEGDVLAGLVAVNPARPDAAELRRRAAGWAEAPYARDLARLAAQIGRTEAVLGRIQASVPRVAAFLEGHPKVREVFWAYHPSSRASYRKIERAPGATGGMISFSLRTPIEPFYDRLRLPKGPSFGMTTTVICPFLYLAHYDLVSSAAGRAELEASGLDPELLRLCVGTEPAEEIIAALAEALEAAP
ncbi:MAG TPA: PLP-dependent transferase [Opitutaceae bacterium]|nr:PLP-dependent transferase [Opitutaceae bacterium]